MSDTLDVPAVRRIVTGHNAEGRSMFAQGGASPAQITGPERPGYRVTNRWQTEPGHDINTPDNSCNHKGVLPPAGGTATRIIEWPAEPEDPAELRRLMDKTFVAVYFDAHRDVKSGKHPGMHTTDTVDYALVLEGEIVAIMDKGEALMPRARC